MNSISAHGLQTVPVDLGHGCIGEYSPPTGEPAKIVAVLCPGRGADLRPLDFIRSMLVERGIAALGVRFRGESARHDDDDCLAGISYIDSLLESPDEAAKVLLIGHSRGGMSVLRTGAKSDRLAGIISLTPICDLASYTRTLREFSRSLSDRFDGNYGITGNVTDDSIIFNELSPINFASRIRVPTLLVAGAIDHVAPADQVASMANRINSKTPGLAKLMIGDRLGHFFDYPYGGDGTSVITEFIVDWLEQEMAIASNRSSVA